MTDKPSRKSHLTRAATVKNDEFYTQLVDIENEMKLTEKKLRSLNPCPAGLDWYLAQEETDLQAICFALIDEDLSGWANWVLNRLMNKFQRISFAIYAADLVIHIFEAEYPKDSRPRDALRAAKRYLKKPTDENKKAATVAAAAARAAARDADAYFDDAVVGVANAAANAASAAYYVTKPHYALGYITDKKSLQLEIINYGLKILAEKKKKKRRSV